MDPWWLEDLLGEFDKPWHWVARRYAREEGSSDGYVRRRIARWIDEGFGAAEAKAWIKVGVTGGIEARGNVDDGLTPELWLDRPRAYYHKPASPISTRNLPRTFGPDDDF